MTTPGEALYRLQELELKLLEHAKRLQAITQQLNDSQIVKAAQKRVDAALAHLKPLQTQQRDLELQLQTARSKRAATEQRLYSGTVKNPKELQEMQQEIAALQRRDGELEESMLETMMAVEEAQDKLKTVEAALTQTTATFEEQHTDLVTERDHLRTEVKQLEERKTQAMAALSPDNLALYQSLKPQKANRPMSKLVGTSCSVCGIEQTAIIAQEVRKQQALVKCKSCGRILVYMP